MGVSLAGRPAVPQIWRLQEFRVLRNCAGVTLSENHTGDKRLLLLPDYRLAAIYVPSQLCPDDGIAAMEMAGCSFDEARRMTWIGADVIPEGPHRPDFGEVRFPEFVDQGEICSYIRAIFSRQHRAAANSELTRSYVKYRVFIGPVFVGGVWEIARQIDGRDVV